MARKTKPLSIEPSALPACLGCVTDIDQERIEEVHQRRWRGASAAILIAVLSVLTIVWAATYLVAQ